MTQHLDPILEKYMKQQRMQKFWGMLSEMGQGLMEANRRGESPIRGLTAGLSAGMAQGGSGIDDLLPILSAQNYLTKARREQRQYDARDMLSSGMLAAARQPAGPTELEGPNQEVINVDMRPGRSLLEREKPGLLGRAYPEAMGRAMVAEMFPKAQERYETVENPYGRGGYGQRSTKTGQISGYQKPAKPTMSARKLTLLNKYRAVQDGKAKWTAADQAEWDMIIQADPMDIMRRNILRDMGRDPAASTPAPGAPVPPGASVEEPGFFERGYDYLFGDGDAAAATTNPPVGTTTNERITPRPVSPRGSRGRLGRAGQKAKNPPRLSNGGIDRSLLVVGQVYLHPADGQIYRWTGTEFVLAR